MEGSQQEKKQRNASQSKGPQNVPPAMVHCTSSTCETRIRERYGYGRQKPHLNEYEVLVEHGARRDQFAKACPSPKALVLALAHSWDCCLRRGNSFHYPN